MLRTLSSGLLSTGHAQRSRSSRVSNMAISVLYTRCATALDGGRRILSTFPWKKWFRKIDMKKEK